MRRMELIVGIIVGLILLQIILLVLRRIVRRQLGDEVTGTHEDRETRDK